MDVWAIWWRTPRRSDIYDRQVRDAIWESDCITEYRTPNLVVISWKSVSPIEFEEGWMDAYVRAYGKDKLITLWRHKAVSKMLTGEIPAEVYYTVEEWVNASAFEEGDSDGGM